MNAKPWPAQAAAWQMNATPWPAQAAPRQMNAMPWLAPAAPRQMNATPWLAQAAARQMNAMAWRAQAVARQMNAMAWAVNAARPDLRAVGGRCGWLAVVGDFIERGGSTTFVAWGLPHRPAQPTVPIGIENVEFKVHFDQPIILTGTPKYTTNLAGVTAVSAVRTSPTSIDVTFSASVDTATHLRVPYEEPAVRNSSGGFVSTSAFVM